MTDRAPTLTSESAAMVSRTIFADCTKAEPEPGYKAVPLRDMLVESRDRLAAEGLLDA